MLMPVQLPCHFRIAHLGKIEVFDLVPGLKRRGDAIDDVGMPADVGAVIQIFIAEQTKTVCADLIGLRDKCGNTLRVTSRDGLGYGSYFTRLKKKTART